MRIPTNHIRSIIGFFRDELKGLYDVEEIENFIFYSFEHYLGFTRTDLSLKANETVTESELLKFNNVVKRLKKEEPIQYILGETSFYGLKFHVNKNVLIPRPETEELVEWIIDEVRSSKFEVRSILDVGTGSGCIPIAIKKNLLSAEVSAIDVSAEALEVARQNAELNSVNVNFIQKDILQLPTSNFEPRTAFDIIVSNPPYITESEKQSMSRNVLENEPHLALFVNDNDPLLFYKAIATFAQSHLADKGKLFFEINEAKGADVKLMLEKMGFKNVEIKKDLSGKDRMIKAEK